MNIIIDMGHPAHVHLFRNFAKRLIDKGHAVLFCVRKKEFNIELLEHYILPYKCLSRNYRSVLGKIYGYFQYELKLLIVAFKFRPDIFIGHSSFYSSHIAFLLRKWHISLEDTGNMEQVGLYKPFTDVILTSTSFKKNLGSKQLFYDGYHELAYLHPNQFTPSSDAFKLLQLNENERYAIVRFVARNSSHDIGERGISVGLKRKIVETLSKYVKVFISSEEELSQDLEFYRLKTKPWEIHDVLFNSVLYFGESATMASEAAIMGVTAIYLDNVKRFYTDEEEKKYGLVFNYSLSEKDILSAINHAIVLLQNPNLKNDLNIKKKMLLEDHIDVTAFLEWFTLEFPKSKKILKAYPEYQLKFK